MSLEKRVSCLEDGEWRKSEMRNDKDDGAGEDDSRFAAKSQVTQDDGNDNVA